MAINPQINDMAWFGKPADPVGSFQKGRNLAEQSQRMKQSADMHPLKMADMKSQTDYRSQQTSLAKQRESFNEDMHPLDMAAKQADTAYRTAVTAGTEQQTAFNEKANPLRITGMEYSNAAAGLINQARDLKNRYDTATLGNKIASSSLSLQAQQNKLDQDNQMWPLKLRAQELGNIGGVLQNAYAATRQAFASYGLGRAAVEHSNFVSQQPILKEAMSNASDMAPADLANFSPPPEITDPAAQEQLQAHVASLKSTQSFKDYVLSNQNAQAESQARIAKARNQVTDLPAGMAKVLEAKDSVGRPRFRDESNNLNADGQDIADRLHRWHKLKESASLTANEADALESEVYGKKVRWDKHNTSLGLSDARGEYSTKGEFVGNTFVPSESALEDLQDMINDRHSSAPAGMQMTKMVVNGRTYEKLLPNDINPEYRGKVVEMFNTLMRGTTEEGGPISSDDAWSKAVEQARELYGMAPVASSSAKRKFNLSAEDTKKVNVIKAKLAAVDDYEARNPDWDKGTFADIDMEQDKNGNWFVQNSSILSPDDYDSLKEARAGLKKELGDILGDRNLVDNFLSPAPVPQGLVQGADGVYRFQSKPKK